MLFISKGFQWISFIFALALHRSASRSNLPNACLHGNSTEALSIVELFDRLVISGPSYSILSELMTFFETRHDHEKHRQNQSECANEIFLSIDNRFVGLDVTIRSLHAMGDLKKSLIETRQTMNNVRKVYFALNLYERQKEPASRDDAVNQCKEFHPRNSLIELKSHVTTPPKLFEEILDGTRYSQVEFEQISEVWLKEAGLCVLLMQACEKLEHANASAALQNARLELASKMLQDIYEMLLNARKKLKVDFKNVVPDDILTILSNINVKKMSRTRAVDMIHQQLSNKFSFRAWAVMMYDRLSLMETAKHVHEGSTDSWFMVNDIHHTVIAHSADKELNCSFFGDNFRNHTLRDIFPNYAAYANFVNSEYNGHLGNAISALKEIFEYRNLPQQYFLSVLSYNPSLIVRRDLHYHYFEHIRLSQADYATKSVLIGWC